MSLSLNVCGKRNFLIIREYEILNGIVVNRGLFGE